MKKEKKEKAERTKRLNMPKKDERNLYIYLLAMTLVLIVANVLSEYEIVVTGYEIALGSFVFPLVYLFSYLVTREYGKEKALLSILIASMFQAGLYLLTVMLSTTTLDSLVITGSIVSFLASQIVFIFLADSLAKTNKVSNKAALFVVYVFAILLDNLIALMMFKSGTLHEYEMPFIISCAVKSLIAIIITYGQYKVEGIKSK